jgi:membrane associated rhomboid family serine protease
MFSFLNNIPPVTKNLLILNVLMFILTLIFEAQGIDLMHLLSSHYLNSPLFQPYQIVSHFFMHGSIGHLLSNMIGLVVFGGFLERIWGARRYMIFYLSCAIGAFALYNIIGVFDVMQAKEALAGYDLVTVNNIMTASDDRLVILTNLEQYLHSVDPALAGPYIDYIGASLNSMLGASGAVFGLAAAFAILFPNTELMLLFFPFPIKAKYLVGGYFIIEVLLNFYTIPGDNIAHLAHVGGAITGGIIVLLWRRNRTHFY